MVYHYDDNMERGHLVACLMKWNEFKQNDVYKVHFRLD